MSSAHLAPPPRWRLPRVPPPTLSVVIPAFDAADTIAEAVESALAQTRRPHEIIVCDDGSSDDLAAALRPYRSDVVLLRRPRLGVAAARNAAVRAARGDFVVMLDSDDAYLPERIEALGDLASERPDLDVLATDAQLEADGVVVGRFHEHTAFAVDDQRTAVLDRCFFAWPAVRRSRLLALGGFDESLRTGSDWECAIRLVLSGCLVGLVPEPLYRYRLRERSLTSRRTATLADRVRLLESALPHPTLTPAERRVLLRSIASKRRTLLRAEAEVALAGGTPDRRRRALCLACARHVPPAERVEALAWAFAPRARVPRDPGHGAASASPWRRATGRRDRADGAETAEDDRR